MALNLLPLLLLGGAAAYVVTSGKKNGKGHGRGGSKRIDKGTYSYSPNCNHFWVGELDLATADPNQKLKLSDEQKTAIQDFASKALMPALIAEADSHKDNPDWDDQPFAVFEWAIGAVARLTPECKVMRGKKISNVALAGMTIAVGQMPVLIQEKGGNLEDFLIMFAADIVLLSKELARVGAKNFADNKFDILAFIDHVRKNPKKYQLSRKEIEEFLSGKNMMNFDFSNMA